MTSFLDLPTTARTIAAEKKLQSVLRLSKLSAEDAGVYTCSSGDLSSTINVKIQDKITFTDSPQGDPIEKSIVVGKDNEVICQVCYSIIYAILRILVVFSCVFQKRKYKAPI